VELQPALAFTSAGSPPRTSRARGRCCSWRPSHAGARWLTPAGSVRSEALVDHSRPRDPIRPRA